MACARRHIVMLKRMLINLMLTISVMITSIAVVPAYVSAAVPSACDKSSSFLSFPTWYKYLDVTHDQDSGRCDISLPKNSEGMTDIQKSIAPILLAVFEILLRVGALLAVGFVIYGGIQYVISQGEPDRTNNARSTILNAIIGLVITIFATAIVNVIARNIT
jgi:hypothetical protein